jgi:imidazolonepropionase-like amidohydrolase
MMKKRVPIAISGVLLLIIVLAGAFYTVVSSTPRSIRKTALDPDLIPKGIEQTVAFVNINVIPMDSERVLEDQTVVVKNGRIAELGASSTIQVPTEALIVDGEGKFLMPGLSDMHMHLFGSENDLLLYLANGVTTIRDMGDGPPVQLEWRDEINAGTRTGPNVLLWSPMFETMDRLEALISSWESPGGKVNANDPDKMEGLVAGFAAQGYDGIKAHVIFSTEIFEAILDSANTHGILLDAHSPIDIIFSEDKASSWEYFRSLEVDGVSHIEELVKILDWSDESIQQAAQDVADDGLWVTTTIALMRSMNAQVSDYEGELAKVGETQHVNPGVYNFRWAKFKPENYRSDIPDYLSANVKMLKALNEAGASLMSGTDAPLPLLVPGFSLHEELEYMVEIGLSPYEALRTSTYNPAVYLNILDESGTVETGKRADLVLLDSNPLEDITNTRQISGVMVRGRWYTRIDLDAMLDEVASANK